MDFQQLLEKYSPFLKQHWLPIGLSLLGLIFFAYGLISFIGSSQSGSGLVFEDPSASSGQGASESAKIANREIVVDVEGAVVKPGVYHIPFDSRIKDGLIAAFGLSSDANRDWVAKNLNLAAKLTDGGKIYIPRVGEDVKGTTHSASSGQAGSININTASISELDTLSGIGAATAQKIIDSRPYGDIAELVSKKVLTSKVFEKIKEKITVY